MNSDTIVYCVIVYWYIVGYHLYSEHRARVEAGGRVDFWIGDVRWYPWVVCVFLFVNIDSSISYEKKSESEEVYKYIRDMSDHSIYFKESNFVLLYFQYFLKAC